MCLWMWGLAVTMFHDPFIMNLLSQVVPGAWDLAPGWLTGHTGVGSDGSLLEQQCEGNCKDPLPRCDPGLGMLQPSLSIGSGFTP